MPQPTSLVQSVRDEIIADIKGLSIPGVNPICIKKLGVLYTRDGDSQILVSVEDEPVYEDVANNLRMLFVTIRVCVYVPKDRDGSQLDTVSSYVEDYVRNPRQFGSYAGFDNVRTSQIVGSSSRIDSYGDDSWYVNVYAMTLPYGRPLPLLPVTSGSGSASV